MSPQSLAQRRNSSGLDSGDNLETSLFGRIANDLRQSGWSVQRDALDFDFCLSLLQDIHHYREEFAPAGIGREQNLIRNEFVRRDEIQWIDARTESQRRWTDFAGRLQVFLNRELLLGLFSFESHFAHYQPGAFYKRHVDAFKGEANRVLSVVLYLNPNWQLDWDGELVLYSDTNTDETLAKVTPCLGTLVVFLSEDFPHEVQPAKHDRYSIAGWYRVNGSTTTRVDPPA